MMINNKILGTLKLFFKTFYMKNLNIKNWDKLRTDADRKAVLFWNSITTVTIYDNGSYTMDLISMPVVKNAHL